VVKKSTNLTMHLKEESEKQEEKNKVKRSKKQ